MRVARQVSADLYRSWYPSAAVAAPPGLAPPGLNLPGEDTDRLGVDRRELRTPGLFPALVELTGGVVCW